ncbi:MAG: 4Fe-4S ferredoxin [Deltaproteobacteria bacterium]|nr:MAG: 4Fe-4S ferredoxin [Deltaproteobacteria bacterium]
MSADVFFMDLTATSRENLPQKLARLVKKAGIKKILAKDDLAAVKIHFGEQGNTSFIRPIYIRQLIQTIRETKATPFLTDANTLYVGSRSDAVSHIKTAIENGFSYSSMDGAPVIIADGLFGKSETRVQVDLKHCSCVYIGSEIITANGLVSVAHFKGHELSGFGGTLKNLGMGCASRRGKLEQHSNVSPRIKRKTCIGCAQCADHCPGQAITLKEKKAYINKALCIGCAECIVRCPTQSININWNQTIPVFLEKMMEYTLGVLKNKQDKALFINFITDIAPKCDCLPYSESPIVSDIGVVVSTDPVAIDQASADLVNNQRALPGSVLTCNFDPGQDKFKGLYPSVDWEHQLDYAEKIGLGTREYNLKRIKTLAYKNPSGH